MAKRASKGEEAELPRVKHLLLEETTPAHSTGGARIRLQEVLLNA